MSKVQDGGSGDKEKIFLDIARAEFDRVDATWRDLEGKSKTWLAINAILIASGVLTVRDHLVVLGGLPGSLLRWFVFFLLVVLGASYYFLLASLRTDSYEGHPDLERLREKHSRSSHERLLNACSRSYVEIAEKNQVVVARKSSRVGTAVVLSTIALITVLLGAGSMIIVRECTAMLDELTVETENVHAGGDGDDAGADSPAPESSESDTVEGTKYDKGSTGGSEK